MDTLMSLPVVALIAGAILALVALLALELLAIRRINRAMKPAMEYARAKAEEEAEHILETTRENARALLARAEASGAALTAERAKEDDAARHAHEEALTAARTRFDASLEELKKSAEEAGAEAREALKGELERVGERARGEFSAVVKDAGATFAGELAKALEEAREGAVAYRKAQEAAVDAKIYELVAETTKLALGKSLPEAASAELVQHALEEAKAAHTF